MLTTSHLPCSGPLVVLMLEEVGSQKHRLDISLELIASLEDTLESCVSLVSMPCVKNLVVGVYPGLQRFQLEATHSIYTNLRMGNFRVLKNLYFVLGDQSSQLFLQHGHRSLEGSCHCVEINRNKWECVLYDSFVANICVQSLYMLMQMNIQ